MWLQAPPRGRGPEVLDDPAVSWTVRERSHRDIVTANRWLGGDRALSTGLRDAFASQAGRTLTLLDVGCGIGQARSLARRAAQRCGVHLQYVALDLDARLAARSRDADSYALCGNALALPLASASVDIAMASLLVHHFEGQAMRTLLSEMNRVARQHVIVHDLRRSRLAVAGLWIVSFPLGFHPVSRHDGVMSVRRGFTPAELAAAIREATGATAAVTRRAGFRLVASWTPGHAPSPTAT